MFPCSFCLIYVTVITYEFGFKFVLIRLIQNVARDSTVLISDQNDQALHSDRSDLFAQSAARTQPAGYMSMLTYDEVINGAMPAILHTKFLIINIKF